jgi:YggT family protein
MSLFYTLGVAVSYAVQIIVLLIIIRAVMSFFPNMDRSHPVVRTLDQVVEPMLMPFQRLIPPMGGLDLSPMVAILVLQFLGSFVAQSLMQLGR